MGLPDRSRLRAVSATSTAGPRDEETAAIVNALEDIDRSSYQSLLDELDRSMYLQQLHHTFKDGEDAHFKKSSFRRSGGFQSLLSLLQALGSLRKSSEDDNVDPKHLLQTLTQILAVLGASLEDHAGNQKYFRMRVDENGWKSLFSALSEIYAQLIHDDDVETIIQQFFGILIATAIGSGMNTNIFTKIDRTSKVQNTNLNRVSVEQDAALWNAVTDALMGMGDLVLPDLLSAMVSLWSLEIQRAPELTTTLRLAMPMVLEKILSVSKFNLVSLHTAGLLSVILDLLFNTDLATLEKGLFRRTALLLCQAGISNLDDSLSLFSKSRNSADEANFLLSAINASRQPPSIEFDLARHGYASTEVASLGKPFPPTDTNGYTLTMWVRFEQFDTEAHTTLFGAFDRTQTCFVLTYLEKDSRHLILQTSIRGSRPSIRFKSTVFHPDRWYHVCIVHKRPRTTSSSRALLFVDGEFVEQQKAGYPANAPNEKNGASAKTQAFFGTPQDLAPNTPNTDCISKWSVASATLFRETLADDLISVFFHLGPTYHGNFQDCLGSFQTYQASAALNLRNESLHPGKEEHSELILAIRQKASNLIGEDLILLNISPSAVLDSDDRNNIDESQLIKSLSKTAAKNLMTYTRSGANSVVINGAIPAINDALTQTRGVAMLMGDPLVTVPQSLDDAAWRLGGCAPLGLGLIHQARTTEEVAVAIDILLQTIRFSWRNSEVMERDSGYAILSMLLKEKLSSAGTSLGDGGKPNIAIPTPNLDRSGLSLKALRSILTFVGYDFDEPENSVINNPLAYKVLLVDTHLWRCGPENVQDLYFGQFIVFAGQSRQKRFNLKRLTRMRVLKRLLEALKSDPVSKTSMPMYIDAFKVLLPQAISAEILRSLALFITFSVNKRNLPLMGRKTLRKETRPRASSSSGSQTPTEGSGGNLSHFDIGVEVLRFYSDMLCKAGDDSLIKKFAKTVTNKWLLYLMSETSPEVVVLSTRILARLLVVHGDAYVKKFKEKTGGFTIMCYRLKRWWHLPALWPACFAILFNIDVANLNLDRSFDLFGFVELFSSKKELSVMYPEIFEVIMGMLQSGLKAIVSSKHDSHKSTLAPPDERQRSGKSPERLSMSTMAPPDPLLTIVNNQHVETLKTVIRFLADLHIRSQKFRDFAASSKYVQDLLTVLFPVVVGSDVVDAATELDARDSTLTFDGADVVVQPLSTAPPVIRTAEVEPSQTTRRGKTLRRGSSFVIVSRDQAHGPPPAKLHQTISPTSPVAEIPQLNEGHDIVQSLLEIVITVFLDQILVRKDFPGLALFLRTPPGFVEHQSYFESWILRNTVSQLSNHLALNQHILSEPKVLTNLGRLFSHFGEALFEGWFIGGADSVLDLSGSILEYLQRSDIAKLKTVRLCAQATDTIRAVVFKTVLLSLSQVQDLQSLKFLEKLTYWQTVLLSAEETQSKYLQLVCCLLYGSLVSSLESVRMTAANLWRIILVQRPEEAAAILGQADTSEQKKLASSFEKLVEMDNEAFLVWVEEHREKLDLLFFGTLSQSWEKFVTEENKRTEDNARSRIARRREKLKQWAREELDREELIRRHEVTFDHWTANIYSSEYLKHQRLLQDFQDDLLFTETSFRKMQRTNAGEVGVFHLPKTRKWRLDQTEGRNRMRIRLHEDFDTGQDDRQPKRKGSDMTPLRLDTKNVKLANLETIEPTPDGITPMTDSPRPDDSNIEPFPEVTENGDNDEDVDAEDSFELIEGPNPDSEDFEDKNRKVMRNLHRGDQVKHVANISRILGLEAVEGLLILGKDYIYLIDNFFQRADGEIVNVWQAPQEERDSYVRMISGRDVVVRKHITRHDQHQARSWKWSDVVSVSKRRFLFRDVAIEIFFGDGRSYLLTVVSPEARNDLHSLINAKAPQFGGAESQQLETSWRYETLKSVEDEPQTLGSRFANVFGQSSVMSATKKWQKGEMSNFHYLMLINTMAGRTYNDLTQYPVFPWVIADYTSEELDLNDPKSFRDLSKPMGCQTSSREAEFRERYKSFAEMGDHNAPAFHYGTHYSSAMIVTSYMIRLQPFVKSYLLLQGGTFDHPDRMFFSIEQAWRSSAQVNMTDVRELTPEFFYLPDFLTNINEFDFGKRQNSDKSIDSVELPPWACGDPKIFIAKQREALESPYVSKHLHKWIDLVFGCKQKGDAAVEAVNVFHHLSYQGAKDLDTITDPVERLATIGIIHNFGQTPFQIFQKPHMAREEARHRYKRLDTAAESLTRLPSTLLDSEEKVASLCYSWKSDKLLCSGAFRLNIPPTYDIYMEWGFSDNSVRFYSADSRKQIGLFEHLHIGQLSCALFADSKTLVTAGTDCTVAVWSVVLSHKSVDLQPKATLFGHRHSVNILQISRSFNALLSASVTGELILWDLNRCEFVRKMEPAIQVNCACINDVTGNVLVCHESQISIFTLNGDLLLQHESGERPGDHIVSCACYEGAGNEWLEREIIFTGHRHGVIRIWSKVIRDGQFELELIRQLNHVDNNREDGSNVSGAITCILPMPQVVYTGDEDGRVYEWNCVQRY